MFKKLVLIAVVLTALLVTTGPALALQYGTPGYYYVDTAYTGTEVGTQSQPFNTLNEGIAAAQANPYGGYVYTKTNGTWVRYGYFDSVNPSDTGASISGTALFILLGLACLILVLAGRFLMRRTRELPSRT